MGCRAVTENSDNLLEMYMYATGVSEIPKEWNQWSCLAIVAAAVGNRVWFQKFAWEQMAPNMYIFLVGPSGGGKGGAIGFAQQFLHPRMNCYTGSATYKSMIDLMTSPSTEGGVARSTMLLVQPELADCIGSGTLANSMIKAMTNWYNPSSQDYQESTRTHGERSFTPPCLSWLAGTTVEWLKQTVDVEAMRSGFFGRVAIAPGTPGKDRVYSPYIPSDYEEVVREIKDRIKWLTKLEGEFTLTAAGREADKEWYETRPEPLPELKPFWRRQHDLNLKIAMILSLCETMDLRIHDTHILKAQDLTDQSARMLPKIIAQATTSQMILRIDYVRDRIKQSGTIKHSTLLKQVYRLHITSEELKRIIDQLREEGSIQIVASNSGGRKYKWRVKRLTLPKDN